MRQRTLQPALVFEDEYLRELPAAMRFTAMALHWMADDQGRLAASPRKIWAELYLEDESTSESDVETHLLRLAEIGYLCLFEVAGRPYLALAKLSTITHPNRSELPDPPPQPWEAPAHALGRTFHAGRMAIGGGGEQGEGTGGASPNTLPDSDLENLPSPFCDEHQPRGAGKGVKCQACGDARMYHRTLSDERAARLHQPD
ncbi:MULTISPECIES: hypothetical protein [unclassified Rathayibacter]|uniref:hypothetical protein n=1 Tax=unclassified Rathayibacter TaxID=2609250 RepID=UPI001889D9E6|nr:MULTISPECIES: hypothetical protein [unclassified Rathayibacter]MBF4463447.1 hypothetical protein [Rathayibacter sp. VKM Ac-2879]MBF4504830.1 hypothetical protein [Rathayibacter sp. VKM Ac-2878]